MSRRKLVPEGLLGLAGDPAGTFRPGDLYFNTTTNKVRVYINSSWTDVSSGDAADSEVMSIMGAW